MTAATLLGQLLIGWLIADLGSGLVHWWQDRVARADWPVIGPWLIAPNRDHHINVLAFAGSSLLARNLGTWIAVAAISATWLALGGFGVIWATATIGGLVVSEVHRLAHLPATAGPIGRVLQETGLIQSPRHHMGHHRTAADRRYCILTDWLNPALDALKVWARLEAAMDRVGLSPNRGTR